MWKLSNCEGAIRTIRVDDRDDVVIELVDQRLDRGVSRVFGEELPGEVLSSHCSDPLSSMYGAMDHHGWLRAFAAGSPNVNPSKSSSLHGASGSKDLGLASEATLQISEKGKVVGIRVIRREPGLARNCSC